MTQRYILISTSNQHLSLPWSYQQKLYTCISCFSSACYMFHPSEPPWFNRHSSITCTVETIKLIFFYGFPYFLITSSPLGPNISLTELNYNNILLYTFLRITDMKFMYTVENHLHYWQYKYPFLLRKQLALQSMDHDICNVMNTVLGNPLASQMSEEWSQSVLLLLHVASSQYSCTDDLCV
jgi:hypothetical protein